MTIFTAALNLILGAAYTGYGILTALEMKRGWRKFGFSHFGAAWIAMAFTCGPHHLAHGFHLGFEGRQAGILDMAAVLIGLPLGVIWLYLRVEAFNGGRGDRLIGGNPGWILALPTVAGIYVTAMVAAMIGTGGPMEFAMPLLPNVGLFVVYMMIGYFLLKTQLTAHRGAGGWSLSGLSLTGVFPTCAIMHGLYIFYATRGLYENDIHTLLIDFIGVPAGIYFLWVVRRLYLQSLPDWNQKGKVRVAHRRAAEAV
ncbi:MAG: hypothetical protein ACRDIU_01205 [Actinomycetota bacterium]